MALIPVLQQTKVNLPRAEFLAGKNLKKVIDAGEGRAQRNLEKLLDRKNRELQGTILKKKESFDHQLF